MIKAIAADMDGTFLNSNNTYDKARFEAIYKQLVDQNIKFIVASGNQYAQLKSFFPEKDGTITYISENGAIIGQSGQLQSIASFPHEFIQEVLDDLIYRTNNNEFILCGAKSAYLLKAASSHFKNFAKKYYYKLAEVDTLNPLPDDTLVKIALDVGIEKAELIVDQLNKKYAHQLLAVSSGHGSIDITIPEINKGSTLAKLLNKWSIQPNELLAFGDANNDLEMIALTKHSYAMQNSTSNKVRQTAQHQAPSNDESGVLSVIESYLFE
ncbi:Cof-type HAD-IIB family hydrolase [Tetragenococcus koreensis]|uniref:Cof-type HAD-IIB family hydrolase n=1 Tax=Tetragenococcus koreensis TaxID=290335 RepID=UPI000F4D9F97|nr:Cof-type HAD-IIB family hydrolase [Tetragenococcus koreensis]AYW45554.1 hydrolase [Tetragenococcus koreensis]MCF1617744.1 Cof-type HAD-IIB family hydrolase [Tetragenococcus koreensis]MCF1622586.1 Cof-type HAD-IIB family hydrolase [Tetragenococcus koreensis]MCF1678643.1 Cof-type HAD-IIB family hydrolase [Tetragenococcus koreensis]MCF1681123.1 Cof-type HAD-IIB family hydrolase [Tetragenococcus koreensis]